MDIITSHNALDFDGLAAMVAAGKLYPSAVKVSCGTLSKNVKQFMALYKDSLIIRTPKEINQDKVTRMIVVDTANPYRLGKLKDLALKTGMEFYVYDHHPAAAHDLTGPVVEIHKVGAATTILVEKIIEKNIDISSFDATILALGIYEDTGSMLFSSTTPRDVSAVAWLLSRGANLGVVANFMDQPFSGEQRHILQELLNSARHYRVKDVDVVLATLEGDDFIPGLDAVAFRLFEMENCDAVFVIAKMQGKVHTVGRSRTSNVRINEIVKTLGGRGHEKAASAATKGVTTGEVVDLVLKQLGEHVNPGLLAQDIMSTPVKSVPKHISMEEAGRIMLRYGHTGMPVVEGEKMVGVISRRDVDKARIHQLGHAPVKGFMTTSVLSVTPETTVSEIQRLMVEYDIGRLPVVDGERLVGIVSRTDILRTLHGEDYPEDHQVLYSLSGEEVENCAELMQERLPARLISMLRLAGELADQHGSIIYCVGGFVRDLFLQVPNFDLDLVVEGDGEIIARGLAQRLGGKERIHPRFKTAVVDLPDGTKIDVATARTEYYEFPAALPTVEKSSIREDMYRRDFTINTLAICLNHNRFGNLIDYFGGRKDLENGCIRILYNLSFVEDPTRILRAIRFEQRYQFTIEKDTLRFARDAIDRNMLGKLSYRRILQELILILSERDPVPALERMKDIGVLKYILPEVKLEDVSRTMLKRTPIVTSWWLERYHQTSLKSWLVYIMIILSSLDEEQVNEIIERYALDSYARRCIAESLQIPELLKWFNSSPLLPSQLHDVLHNWTDEGIVYLLLCIRDEDIWEAVVRYLDARNQTKVEITGHDLKRLGLKQGPIYRMILDELYRNKLNGLLKNREAELQQVKIWIKEEKFAHVLDS
ncbi:CBS domain-containing protein [Syntrophomonas erecta]